jgi:Fic family protein
MVYHEIRKVKEKKQNYLVKNSRNKGKWVKDSKFIGYGKLSKKVIEESKKQFEKELISKKKYDYLSEKELNKIEKLKQEYGSRLSTLHKEEYEKFEEAFFTELTYDSNAIEGSSLSLQETSLIINEGLVPKGKNLREIYEAKNHLEALKFVRDYSGELNELFILKLHSIILKDISERFAGRYRESNVKILGSDVKLPNFIIVPQLIKNLIYWYKENKKKHHPFELAILFSMKFVTIHPFIDGNGRASRLLMNFILKKNKYPLINIYKKDRQDYLNAVRKANDESYSKIFNFSIKSLEKNIKNLFS